MNNSFQYDNLRLKFSEFNCDVNSRILYIEKRIIKLKNEENLVIDNECILDMTKKYRDYKKISINIKTN